MALVAISIAVLGGDDEPPHTTEAEPADAKVTASLEATPAVVATRLPEDDRDDQAGPPAPATTPQPPRAVPLAADPDNVAATETAPAPIAAVQPPLSVAQQPIADGRWSVLAPVELSSKHGATFEPQPDGSFLVTGANSRREIYTFVADTQLNGITGLRLEALADDRLPQGGPGRRKDGVFSVAELEVAAAPRNGSAAPQPVELQLSRTKPTPSGDRVDALIDGRYDGGWTNSNQVGQSLSAEFETKQAVGSSSGIRLTFTIFNHQGDAIANLGRFRVAVSNSALPEEPAVVKPEPAAAPGPEPAPTSIPSSPAESKSPPSAEVLAEAQRQVREIFAGDYQAARTPETKRELGRRLLGHAGNTSNPADRYALLAEARQLATEAGDVETAFAAIEQTEKQFGVAPLPAKTETLHEMQRDIRTPAESSAFLQLATSLVYEALDSDQFDLAEQLGDMAVTAARKTRDTDVVKAAVELTREVSRRAKAIEEVQAALETLASDPDDPAANLLVGKYRCLVQDDWATGLRYLAKSGEPQLEEAARLDLAGAETPQARVQLGDAWWQAARNEKQFQQRAGHWWGLAAPELAGLEKAAVDKKLQQVTITGNDIGHLAADACVVVTFDRDHVRESAGRQQVVELGPNSLTGDVNGSLDIVPGVAGMAARFKPPSYLNFPPPRGKNFPQGTDPRTLSAWIKLEAPGEISAVRTGGTREGAKGVSLDIRVREHWQLNLYNHMVRTSVPADDAWHHHCVNYDGKLLRYFIDGNLVAQEIHELATLPGRVLIGTGNVTVDEVVLFSRSLDEREMATLYELGQSRRPLLRRAFNRP